MACPHADIRFCPLYIAAHGQAVGFGCDDGKIFDGRCGVARAISYREQLERLRIAHPGFIEQIEWRQEAERLQVQRGRNLRLNGIH